MRSGRRTEPTAPAWILEEVRRREGAWPPLVLAAALAIALAVKAAMGMALWSAQAFDCYVRP